MKGKLVFIWALWHLFFGAQRHINAQAIRDTSLQIPTVYIQAKKLRKHPVGQAISSFTKSTLQQGSPINLSDFLSQTGDVFIKSYGLGSLGTSSIRGGSAGHTVVLWNDIPLTNPMLGLMDLSTIPINSLESITIQRGGNSALWGNGAIGGSIHLDDHANYSNGKHLSTNMAFGSFNRIDFYTSFGLKKEKWFFKTAFNHLHSINDFTYKISNDITRKQTNAQVQLINLQQQFGYQLSPKTALHANIWFQQANRQIPPTSVQNKSVAFQNDWNLRQVVKLKHQFENGHWASKCAWFKETIRFNDQSIQLISNNTFNKWLLEMTRHWQISKKHSIMLGLTNQYLKASSSGYKSTVPRENRAAVFASYHYKGRKFEGQLSIRQAMINKTLTPTIPSLGLSYVLSKNWTIKALISRNYRFPTLNDRYWIPGGNPMLTPESGWSESISLCHQYIKANWHLKYECTIYNKNIKDWILWHRAPQDMFWSASNIAAVWSRGFEPSIEYHHQFKRWKIQSNARYNFVRSTNQITLKAPKISAGEQLFYTPIHTANITSAITFQSILVRYSQTFTGATNGINIDNPHYSVANLQVQYTNVMKHGAVRYYFKINNLWNVQYEVIERRPMPGTQYNLGIQFSLHKNN